MLHDVHLDRVHAAPYALMAEDLTNVAAVVNFQDSSDNTLPGTNDRAQLVPDPGAGAGDMELRGGERVRALAIAVPPMDPDVLLVSRPKPHISRARDSALRATCAATADPHEKDAGAAMRRQYYGQRCARVAQFHAEAPPAHDQCDLGRCTIDER
ncbi:hypothetical protein B0H13DRAFT_2326465 [Mycena leptocephala]|nr:hypothetical protein B0H13DRAFT_2326465 [Mycena leptocephala]